MYYCIINGMRIDVYNDVFENEEKFKLYCGLELEVLDFSYNFLLLSE